MSNAKQNRRESIHDLGGNLNNDANFPLYLVPLQCQGSPRKWKCNGKQSIRNREKERWKPYDTRSTMKYGAIMRCECPRVRKKWSTRQAHSGRVKDKTKKIARVWGTTALDWMQDSMQSQQQHQLQVAPTSITPQWNAKPETKTRERNIHTKLIVRSFIGKVLKRQIFIRNLYLLIYCNYLVCVVRVYPRVSDKTVEKVNN